MWATYCEDLQTGREQQLQQQEELTNHQTVSAARYAVDLLEESLSDESLIRSSINVLKSGLSQNGNNMEQYGGQTVKDGSEVEEDLRSIGARALVLRDTGYQNTFSSFFRHPPCWGSMTFKAVNKQDKSVCVYTCMYVCVCISMSC